MGARAGAAVIPAPAPTIGIRHDDARPVGDAIEMGHRRHSGIGAEPAAEEHHQGAGAGLGGA